MIKIIFSEHALRRVKEREIDLELAKLALKETFEVIDVKFGRKACYKKMDDDYFLVVIFEEKIDEILIVTVVKVDDIRLKRYGFNRI